MQSSFLVAACSLFASGVASLAQTPSAPPTLAKTPDSAVRLFPLSAVRLLDGPFTAAVRANREYMLALEPDRLLAPFLQEAGLPRKADMYGNWESGGLGGHTAGHYLAALADMIAAGADTPGGELRHRLDYMLSELERCQKAFGDGYLGGVPGSRALWAEIAAGHIQSTGFNFNGKWVPWYNLHKTFAGLRDIYFNLGDVRARNLLVNLGNWCDHITAGLSDAQMQTMLGTEQGGMDEVLADLYAITGEEKFLRLARRFVHHAVIDPLEHQQDQLTGKHANTQIPKVIGLERLAALTADRTADGGARFFWENVTGIRSVAFGGNSVSEHFNDPKDFRTMLEHREGPETCNTYNMLRLTEALFAAGPKAAYADYYERALYNHLLSAINPAHPGYVYFTPIRPGAYRVYSQPGQGFWCCVGTGMENPGRYGQFVYARGGGDLYVNLFVASELTLPGTGLTVRQETAFPDEERTRLTLRLARPDTFGLRVRHPGWVAGPLAVRVNGAPFPVESAPGSYALIRREWRNGDRVEIDLPMQNRVERLPDGSDWYAILHGPILLASPDGTDNLVGLRAGSGRGDHIAHGPLIALDKLPTLVTAAADLPRHVVPDPAAGPLHFRLRDAAEPGASQDLALVPFFRLHDARYQMYWQLATADDLAARKARLAADERVKLARDAGTIDAVAVGEQQPEADHAMTGENTESGTFEDRRYRQGKAFQYTLDTQGEKAADLLVTYAGVDRDRQFDVLANGKLLATVTLDGKEPGRFVDKRYQVPPDVLASAPGGRVTIRFVARRQVAGGVYDVRLMRREMAEASTAR